MKKYVYHYSATWIHPSWQVSGLYVTEKRIECEEDYEKLLSHISVRKPAWANRIGMAITSLTFLHEVEA